jgi:hypothetical protein
VNRIVPIGVDVESLVVKEAIDVRIEVEVGGGEGVGTDSKKWVDIGSYLDERCSCLSYILVNLGIMWETLR